MSSAAALANRIKPGTVRQIHTAGESHGNGNDTVLQVIQIISVKGTQDRFRVILSDGEFYVQGMLATQLNPLIHSNELVQNSVIKIVDCMNNRVKDKLVVILLNIEILGTYPDGRYGAPKDYEKFGNGPSSVTSSVAAPQPLYQQQHPLANSTNNNTATSNPYGGAGTTKASPVRSNPYGGGGSSQRPGPVGGGAGLSSNYGGAPIVRDNNASHITPIAGLNMYNNRWTIRARIVTKSDIRTWSNAKGEGSLFSAELLDGSCDIKCTFFKEAVDKFYHMLQVGKVYRFSGGRLKVANTQYNTCKSTMEITFDQNSEIHLDNDTGDIQKVSFDFQKIEAIEQMEAGKTIDVLAVVKSISDPATLTSKKTGQELTKCDAILVDDSGVEISLTFWGEKAKNAPFEYQGQPIVACRRCRVGEYNGGKTLSASDSVLLNPFQDVPAAHVLQQWWTTHGQEATSRSLSATSGMGGGRMDALVDRKPISTIKEDNMGSSEQADWLSFKATLTFLKKDKEGGAWYPACPNAGEPCKNRFKVSQATDGTWYCDKCQGNFPTCVRRWIFSAVVEDDTSSTWISFFNEQAEALLGMTADECYAKSYQPDGSYDQDAYDSVFAAKGQFSEWIMKCKAKQEVYDGQPKVKVSVVQLAPVDYLKESKDMLAELAKL